MALWRRRSRAARVRQRALRPRATEDESVCCKISSRLPSQFLRNSGEKTAAHSELRCEHADARAIPELVDGVEDVHDIEANRNRLPVGDRDLVRDLNIEIGVGGDMVGIGKSAA